MAKLIYINNMSLDGYFEDWHGAYDFGPMDDDVFMTDKPGAEDAKKDLPAKAFLAFPLYGEGKAEGYLFL